MTAKCPTCGQRRKTTSAQRRATSTAKSSAFETGRCHACHATTLTGWSDAQLRILNANPLNQVGEMAATALGLSTFVRKGDRFLYRSAMDKRTFPSRPNTVHVEHRCTQQWPDELREPLIGHTQLNKSTNEDFPNEPTF